MNISEEFYFNPKAKLTVSISNAALRKYASNFEECSKLEGELPIILDTNILLGYYGMSQQEKDKLIEFLDKFKDRIILTKQVESEFLKNRLTVIKKDFFGPLSKIADDYIKMRNDIEGSLKSFRESKKKILSQDYPDLFTKLQAIEEEVKATINNDDFIDDIRKRVEETTTDHKNIALLDSLLDKVSNFKITEELTAEELGFLEGKFIEHILEYKNEKEISRWKLAIPGCGETKEDADGDYLIYHEAIKYMAENKTSAIFLTNDVTKGDWLQFDKNPHNHYIEHTFRLTDEILFIIHAERTLPKISFENIHTSPQIKTEVEVNSIEPVELESTIISIDTEKGFGFIYTKDENLFFSYADFEGNFRELCKNDVVSYEVSTNFNSEPKAVNVRKIVYDFNSPDHEIHKSEISHINKYRGIGFVSHQPENLYFHQAFLDETEDFNEFEIGDEVEYLIGKNDEGEHIARKVRLVNKIMSSTESLSNSGLKNATAHG
tara:strand:+ start:244 stop:1719 length:1476 start_codon:yes stop_codon:yes gene_type:complete